MSCNEIEAPIGYRLATDAGSATIALEYKIQEDDPFACEERFVTPAYIEEGCMYGTVWSRQIYRRDWYDGAGRVWW